MIDDFDELASAYLDGQTTSAEADRVETDPDLKARVAAFGALSQELERDVAPPDPATRARHLEAALAAFDAAEPGGPMGEDSGTDGAPIIDRGMAARPTGASTTDEPAPAETAPDVVDRARSGRGGMPGWFALAAVLLLVVGGVGFVSLVDTGSDDETVAALDEDASDEEATDDQAEAVPSASAESDAAAPVPDGDDAEADMAGELAESAEDADDAVAQAPEGDEAATTDDALDATEAGDDGADAASDGDDGGGLFGTVDPLEEARIELAEIPTDDELADLAEPGPNRVDPAFSNCAERSDVAGGELVQYVVPVAVGNRIGEILALGSGPDPELVLVDENCEVWPG